MAPTGPRSHASSRDPIDEPIQQPPIPDGVVPLDHSDPARGPHPGHVQVACQFTLEQKLRRMLKEQSYDPAREDTYRLQGVQLIDNVRESLHLPIRTFDTACFYYHLFRLCHRDVEYNYQDAALASLFLACKVEDTIKKSKEILCAAYNIKNADYPTTQDDKMFEGPARIITGLERLILETIGFDFRSRYVQKYLVKATRVILGSQAPKDFFALTYHISIDLHKTFAPIKHATWTMALAVIEMAARVTGTYVEEVRRVRPSDWHTSREDILEALFDLLDLYTHHTKATRLGSKHELNRFIQIRIDLNKEMESSYEQKEPKIIPYSCDACEMEPPPTGFTLAVTPSLTPSFTPGVTPGSATSPATAGSGSNPAVRRSTRGAEGTMRFVFDKEQAQKEQDAVNSYLHEDYEDVEIDVIEKVPEPERRNNKDRGDGWNPHPYPRNRDRRKGNRRR
ncbi:cyclin-like protein [Sodiomyces alkalinus F11]|uniref:RNA polymerase II holoenzyme cyclin-like subunit n=1 Tax=Sodiomyces alkalinus (strain CBS 110278 / VKM F-3762 / F11) TaxID=1314773 RepID=A0A3N2Q8L8_SODAK|nr:cyclin-like protein [Sodiomyces alkalinus F11]ROT43037.1 cyclin-like protein [Sodiomyces alkalinus F11]